MMTFSVKRSPARACWWVMCNGSLLATTDTKREANELASNYRRSYA